jgi:protein gp37
MLLGKQSLFIVRTIRNKQIYKNSVRTPQETYYVSATKPNRLMQFRETLAVIVRNVWNTQIHSVGRMLYIYGINRLVFIADT